MKKIDYRPGLTVCTESEFLLSEDRRQLGETMSPEPRRKDGDKSGNLYVQVRWRNGRTSIVSLALLKLI